MMQTTCNLCHQNSYKVLEGDKGKIKLVRCNYCGLIYVTPFPSKEFIKNYYNLNYCVSLEQQQSRTIKIWKIRLRSIERFQSKGRLLDVGCGVGTFLFLAKNKGWEVYGTEISQESCKYIKERLGLEIHNGELKNANYPDEYFDVITLWHTLEHMDDPSGTLKLINRLLKKDGLLVVATPNVNNYIHKILYLIAKIRRRPFLQREKRKELHFYYFSPVTIKKILQKAGFSVFLIKQDKIGITLLKCIIDKIADFILYPLRINFALSMQVCARKM